MDPGDVAIGSLGSWTSVEKITEGGAANPPFKHSLLEEILTSFEQGVQSESPYCRCALLLIGKGYDLPARLRLLTSEGHLLLSIPPGCLPFRNENTLLTQEYLKPKAHMHQCIGLFIWCNRAYLLKNQVPLNVEDVYQAWVGDSLLNPRRVVIHREEFLRAFPVELRDEEGAEGFITELWND